MSQSKIFGVLPLGLTPFYFLMFLPIFLETIKASANRPRRAYRYTWLSNRHCFFVSLFHEHFRMSRSTFDV